MTVTRETLPESKLAAAPLTLLCCAHSGGSASFFRGWPALGVDRIRPVAVQYPGREERSRDPLPRRLLDLADDVVDLAQQVTGPVALFGHSMGAAVAFEAARTLTAAGRPPVAVVASARTTPARPIESRIHELPGLAMWLRLAELGGLHPEVLQHQELCDLLEPIVREDLRVSETYVYDGALPALDCPVLAASGAQDPIATPAAMQAWASITSGRFASRTFDGDHFFLGTSAESLLSWIVETVADWSGPAAA